VRRAVSGRVAQALVSKSLQDDGLVVQWEKEPAAAELLARALVQPPNIDLTSSFTLQRPLVGIGAPADAFLPHTAHQLHTRVVIPEHAEVANAIGAVVGSVVQHRTIEIQPVEDRLRARFRVYLPDGIHDFATLDECVHFTEEHVRAYITRQAQQAGARQVEVHVQRHDRIAPVQAAFGGELYLGTDLIFTAVGRPSLRRERPYQN
jgi:N-methylhydantoinase A/oxoprolinase/acetone carboxylase beta subunit